MMSVQGLGTEGYAEPCQMFWSGLKRGSLGPESPGKVKLSFKDGYRIYFRAVRIWGDLLPQKVITYFSHVHVVFCIQGVGRP